MIVNIKKVKQDEKKVVKTENDNDNSILEMFGLTYRQSLLLFSAEKLVAENDCHAEKNENKRNTKAAWITEWEKGILEYLKALDKEQESVLLTYTELQKQFREELYQSHNRTWYYIVALELIEFVPYSPLGSNDDKQYLKCKYDDKGFSFTASLLHSHGYLSKEKIERLDKVYTKSLSQISGKAGSVAIKALAIVSITAVATAIAAIGAPQIAVAIYGKEFAFYGAALTSVCLASACSGVAAFMGVTGMAGGVLTIAGGGAILGIAVGGTAVGIGSALMLSAPEYTLTQAAKLETVLKEVILNAQQDVVSAQKIIQRYREQIAELNKQLASMELENENNKKEIKNIKTCIKYLTKSYKDMNAFTAAYEIGLQNMDENDGKR